MQEITKVFKVYHLEELEEKVREKLIENEMEIIQQDYLDLFLYEDMEQKARELLREYFGDKAEINKIQYSLRYCQGDGAMIEFNLLYYNKELQIKNYGHYCHSMSFSIYGDIDGTRYEKLYNKIVDMNEELTKYGYELIENCSGREDAINALNDHLFLKNGTFFTEIEDLS